MKTLGILALFLLPLVSALNVESATTTGGIDIVVFFFLSLIAIILLVIALKTENLFDALVFEIIATAMFFILGSIVMGDGIGVTIPVQQASNNVTCVDITNVTTNCALNLTNVGALVVTKSNVDSFNYFGYAINILAFYLFLRNLWLISKLWDSRNLPEE